jgi:hypothetical protein
MATRGFQTMLEAFKLYINSHRAHQLGREPMVCRASHCEVRHPHISFESCEFRGSQSDGQRTRPQIRPSCVR